MNSEKTNGLETKFKNANDVLSLLRIIASQKAHRLISVDCEILPDKNKKEPPFMIDGDLIEGMTKSGSFFEFLKAEYLSDGKEIYEIETYSDYKNGSCELLLLVIDVYCVELYCKNTALLGDIIAEVKKLDTFYLDYKTEENDVRTNMNYY